VVSATPRPAGAPISANAARPAKRQTTQKPYVVLRRRSWQRSAIVICGKASKVEKSVFARTSLLQKLRETSHTFVKIPRRRWVFFGSPRNCNFYSDIVVSL